MTPTLPLISPRVWYFPSESGDFRLLPDGDGACVLTVENPTPAELPVLDAFLAAVKRKKWGAGVDLTVAKTGLTTIPLRTPIQPAAAALAKIMHPGTALKGLWTAVRSEAGQVVLVSALPEPPPASVDPAPADGEKPGCVPALVDAIGAALAPSDAPDPAPAAAATLPAPQRGCPAPEPCNRRASAVLRAFSTASQWAEWEREGRMTLIGSRTGYAYDLFHRNVAARRRLTHVLVERRSGDTICAWDDRVPPEEEALGIKLAIEHREGWLRGLGVQEARAAVEGRRRETWAGGRKVVPTVHRGDY